MKDKMLMIDTPVEFVGYCDETGRLRCGLLSTLLDLDDLPLTGTREGGEIKIHGSGQRSVAFKASETLLTALDNQAQFWFGNLEGSEQAWPIDLVRVPNRAQ